jgi:uncharacterized spore protein YtfJ
MNHLYEILELVSDRLSQFSQSEVVIGEAMEFGDVTIVPLSRISVGFGGGGGEGEADFACNKLQRKASQQSMSQGMGGGAGAGGKVRPVGVIIFDKDGVHVQPLPTRKGLCDKIFDRVPEVIDLIKKAQGDSD